ncbi:MAG: B12-binding domain-containing radical SAM protein [Alphaproteobacteria bacterium]
MTEAVDILFINPGDRRQTYQSLGDEFCGIEPPVFAGLYATHARRRGLSVAIYDAPAMFASAEEAARVATEEYDATLIVIVVFGLQPSASTQNMTSAGRIARLIREARPSARLLMVGTHPAALPERTMREEAVDFVCDREGPVTIVRTAEALRAGASDFSHVPSLWWRREGREGQIVPPTSVEPLIRDLDGEMPGIAWDLLPMDRYRAHNWHCFDHIGERTPYAAIHTSLGCPYHCKFCCINAPFSKPSYRMWTPETVVAEIDHLVHTYGVRNIKFVDEMFVLNRRHVLGICDLLRQRNHGLNIWAYARVDTVEDDVLESLKAAGVNWLCLGIESGSETVRDGAAKVYSNADIIDVVRRIQRVGIRVAANFIFGLPDDTMARMEETLALALDLNCEFANFYSAMAYPGSALYDAAVAEGAILPARWHDYSQHGFECLPLANRHCTSAEILAFRDRAWLTYFTSPRYLEMIENTFGSAVVEHVRRMTAIPLPRKLTPAAA